MTLEQAQQEADRLNREQRLKKGKWTAHCYNGEWIVSPVFRPRRTAWMKRNPQTRHRGGEGM